MIHIVTHFAYGFGYTLSRRFQHPLLNFLFLDSSHFLMFFDWLLDFRFLISLNWQMNELIN